MEPEKINELSSENGSAIIYAEKAKDSEETTLKPLNVTSPYSVTSGDKTHDKNEESIEKESFTKSQTDNTGLTVSQVKRSIL